MSSLEDQISDRKVILLFYHEAECDTFVKYDRYLKRAVRPFYNKLHRRQKKSGFGVCFEMLRLSLVEQGWVVRTNDYATARKYPDYPVGLVGYPELVENWTLPNPAILGPALYDHPALAPRLMQDPRFRLYLLSSQWACDMFRPYYGDACALWFAGIDTRKWRDTAAAAKDIDFLIYDKIRWEHDRHEVSLLRPIELALQSRGFRTEIVRYRHYDHDTYRHLLDRSRAMVFLCEHETQGLACQEAMACNVPILAWDNGYWLDPLWQRFSTAMIPASSTPYFSPACGERFVGWADFEPALDRFVARLPHFEPRKFVCENLSIRRSAEIYSRLYFSLLAGAAAKKPPADRNSRSPTITASADRIRPVVMAG